MPLATARSKSTSQLAASPSGAAGSTAASSPGIGAERQRFQINRLAQRGEAARAIAIAERDPAIGQDMRDGRARPTALARRHVARGRRLCDPGGASGTEAIGELAPGRARRGLVAARRTLLLEELSSPRQLVIGQPGLVRIDVDRVGIDAHQQIDAAPFARRSKRVSSRTGSSTSGTSAATSDVSASGASTASAAQSPVFAPPASRPTASTAPRRFPSSPSAPRVARSATLPPRAAAAWRR